MKKNKSTEETLAVKWLFTLCVLAFLPLMVSAQIEVVGTNDGEIDIIDAQGQQEVIDFPASMSVQLDSLLGQYMSQTYMTYDNECQMGSENPTFSKEVYIERLHRMPTVMEMPYNEVVQACIDRYMGRMRHQVSWMLGAANFYMPIFEEALEAYQLPLELKYLPVIESALNPTAVSRAGATGLWQFMLSTGKAYGLEINSLVDERRDIQKSSYAAAHLLSDLYKLFGDWNLVIAAYNCGPENINKAIRRAGGETDYWKIYPYLPRETRGYVPAFIAANYAMNYYCEHNICPMRSELPVKTDTVMIDRHVTLDQVAAVCNYDIQMLRALNPAYRRDVIPGHAAPAPLRLAVSDMARFIDLQDSVYTAPSSVQKRTVVDVPEDAPNTTKKRGRSGATQVTVRRGDTLSAIAKRNGTTVNKIKQLNGLRGNSIRQGQKLRVR